MGRTVATNTDVDAARLLEFTRPRHSMVLMTWRADGGVQSSPVTGGVDADGRVLIATYPERAKVHNARRAGKASMLVLSDDFGGAWVHIDCTAEVVDLPEALEPLVEYFRSIAGEHPDWNEYRRAMVVQGKCLLRLTPQRWGPVATGGFPARLE